jgi:alanine-synthesizing transaminase
MFSGRVPRSLEPNRIARAAGRARAAGAALTDLTATNPTAVGIPYPPEALDALSSAAALRYDPDPFGAIAAREAVAGDYARRGLTLDPSRIVLTASTSEAYSLLFKLLCAPSGDAVLVPAPSYPLFDHLTMLDGVRAVPYQLHYHGRWTLEPGELARAWSPAVRAVLAVSPNNPTGSVLTPDEMDALSGVCADRDAALILDEVFADYPLDPSVAVVPAAAGRCLTFRLGGLSKSAGLPQVKLGWIAIDGPEAIVRDALERLAIVCDAYLSVSTPVQVAAPSLICTGALVRARIAERIRTNARALAAAATAFSAVEVLATEAGWSSVIRIPSTRSEEDVVVDLLERDRVLVHPGFFFDFPREAFLVVSLLPDPQAFAAAVRRIMERVDV